MGFKRALNSRVVAVGAGAAVLALLAGGAGYAAGQIDSGDIEDETILSRDVKDGKLRLKDLSDGTQKNLQGQDGKDGQDGEDGQDGQDGKDAFADMQVAALAQSTPIENIGGGINQNNTDLGVKLTLEPGKYLVTIDGAFISDQAAGDGTPAVWPQLSLWIDRSADGSFQWQENEGDISPNALMPPAADRHISVHGSTIVTVEETTEIGLLGFGYAADQSTARSGEIDVNRAVLTATPLP